MTPAQRLNDPGFGNYMLNGLQEISLPQPPSYQPQTIGWAILAGIITLGLIGWGVQRYRLWFRNRYRRAALQRLAQLESLAQQASTQAAALQALSGLLKQTALAVYPREQVAHLSGEDWLNFLDCTYPGQGFTRGRGRLLCHLAYQSPVAIAQLPPDQVTGLMATAHDWIKHHRPQPAAKTVARHRQASAPLAP